MTDYEVVVGANRQMDQEHAELVKRQLTDNGFLDSAVAVRKTTTENDQ